MADGTQWIGFVCALGVLDFTTLVLVNVQAFRARNIHDDLSELKYIGLSMLSMLQIFIVAAPLLVLVHTDPSANFFVWAGIIFTVSSTILGLIFVPKVMSWKCPKPNKTPTKVGKHVTGKRETLSTLHFSDKQSELLHRHTLNDLQSLVLEKYNIDISSVILKLHATVENDSGDKEEGTSDAKDGTGQDIEAP